MPFDTHLQQDGAKKHQVPSATIPSGTGVWGPPHVQPHYTATALAQLSPGLHHPKTNPPTPPGPAKAKSIEGQLPRVASRKNLGWTRILRILLQT